MYLSSFRLDFGERVEEEEISEETITTTTRRKKKRRTVSSSRAEHSRNKHRQHQRRNEPKIVVVEQPLKLESAGSGKSQLTKSYDKLKKHHASDSGDGGGFTFVTSIEKDFPARYEWKDCLVPLGGEKLDGNGLKNFQRRDSNQSTASSNGNSSNSANNNISNNHFEEATSTKRSTKNNAANSPPLTPLPPPPPPPTATSSSNQVVTKNNNVRPTTVVKSQVDPNGGVTKTVTTTTTEEREYRMINYDHDPYDGSSGSDHDNMRLIAATTTNSTPKKRVVTFNDDLKLALDDRRMQHIRNMSSQGRRGSGSNDRGVRSGDSGTLHVPVKSEVRSNEQDDSAFRLRFLWRQPQIKGPSHVCSVCQVGIEGRCVTALFKKFHPEHFVCSYCLAQLSQGTFKEQGNKPYCQRCYNRLETM
jgi:hypothetical protein